jgi:hypothetical protein
VLAKGGCRTLFATFLGIFRFESAHQELRKELLQQTQIALGEIREFFTAVITSSPLFGDARRSAILKFISSNV